jgi:PAS domain S-box-containing protein
MNEQDLHRLLVELAPQFVSQHSSEGKFLYASPAMQHLLGYTHKEVIGKHISDFVNHQDWRKIRSAMHSLRNTSDEQSVEYRLRASDAREVWVKTTFRLTPATDGEVFAWTENISAPKDIEAALQILAHHHNLLSGEDWFHILVSHLTTALKVKYAFLTEVSADGDGVQMLSFWKGDAFAQPYAYPLVDTPCHKVIRRGEVCYYPLNIQGLFPKDADLVALNAQGYLGVPVYNLDGQVIGHLAILDDRVLRLSDAQQWLVTLFANRAGMELERLHRQQATKSVVN